LWLRPGISRRAHAAACEAAVFVVRHHGGLERGRLPAVARYAWMRTVTFRSGAGADGTRWLDAVQADPVVDDARIRYLFGLFARREVSMMGEDWFETIWSRRWMHLGTTLLNGTTRGRAAAGQRSPRRAFWSLCCPDRTRLSRR